MSHHRLEKGLNSPLGFKRDGLDSATAAGPTTAASAAAAATRGRQGPSQTLPGTAPPTPTPPTPTRRATQQHRRARRFLARAPPDPNWATEPSGASADRALPLRRWMTFCGLFGQQRTGQAVIHVPFQPAAHAYYGVFSLGSMRIQAVQRSNCKSEECWQVREP